MKSTARISGAIMKTHWRKPLATRRKADRTIVSEVDLRISQHVCQSIQQRFPSHALLTEETYQEFKPAGRGFIIDELDGTQTYLRGEAGFTFQMAYFEDYDQLKIGLIYDPIEDLMTWCIKGQPAFISKNGFVQPLDYERNRTLDKLIYGHHRNRFNHTLWQIYQHLGVQPRQIVSSGCIGSKALNLILGKFDAIIGPHRHIPVWDWAAGKVITEPLGLEFFHFNGEEPSIDEIHTPHPFGYVVCPSVHKQELLDHIQQALNGKSNPHKMDALYVL